MFAERRTGQIIRFLVVERKRHTLKQLNRAQTVMVKNNIILGKNHVI